MTKDRALAGEGGVGLSTAGGEGGREGVVIAALSVAEEKERAERRLNRFRDTAAFAADLVSFVLVHRVLLCFCPLTEVLRVC